MNDQNGPEAGNQGAGKPEHSSTFPQTGVQRSDGTPPDKGKPENDKEDPYRHRMFVLTLLSLFVAAFGTVVASVATYLSANQTQVSRQALVAVQRAFVFPTEIQLKSLPIPTQGREVVLFHPTYENSGATPTENLYQYFKVELVNRESIRSFNMDPPSSTKFVFTVMGPHSTAPGGQDYLPMTDALSIGRLDRPDAVAFGELHYQDVFGASHVTKFCTDYQSVTVEPASTQALTTQTSSAQPAPVAQQYQVFAQACPVHNCADDECNIKH